MRHHRISYRLFPFYSLRLDQLMNNALVGRWIAANSSVPKVNDRHSLYRFLAKRFEGQPIDYLEFGVWQGDSIRQWASLNSHPETRLFGFDSFEGLPEDWDRSMSAGTFDVQGVLPKIDDKRVSFVKGWFQDTLPGFLAQYKRQDRLVVNIDADLHSSTLYCLVKLDPIITPGTIVIFDEFVSALHEFRAYHEYCKAFRREMRPLCMSADFADHAAFEVVK